MKKKHEKIENKRIQNKLAQTSSTSFYFCLIEEKKRWKKQRNIKNFQIMIMILYYACFYFIIMSLFSSLQCNRCICECHVRARTNSQYEKDYH